MAATQVANRQLGKTPGVPNIEEWIALTSTYTLTNTTSLQKLFNVPSNGAFTALASRTYFFEVFATLSAMSATSGNLQFDVLGAGTATLASVAYAWFGYDGSTINGAAALSGAAAVIKSTSTAVVTAAIGTGVFFKGGGILRTTNAGTLIPSVALLTAAAAIVGVNSYFRIWDVGSSSTTNTSSWT